MLQGAGGPQAAAQAPVPVVAPQGAGQGLAPGVPQAVVPAQGPRIPPIAMNGPARVIPPGAIQGHAPGIPPIAGNRPGGVIPQVAMQGHAPIPQAAAQGQAPSSHQPGIQGPVPHNHIQVPPPGPGKPHAANQAPAPAPPAQPQVRVPMHAAPLPQVITPVYPFDFWPDLRRIRDPDTSTWPTHNNILEDAGTARRDFLNSLGGIHLTGGPIDINGPDIWDGLHWRGVKYLGAGSFGAAGLWVELDPHHNKRSVSTT